MKILQSESSTMQPLTIHTSRGCVSVSFSSPLWSKLCEPVQPDMHNSVRLGWNQIVLLPALYLNHKTSFEIHYGLLCCAEERAWEQMYGAEFLEVEAKFPVKLL